jgi:cold shock CspA family protein
MAKTQESFNKKEKEKKRKKKNEDKRDKQKERKANSKKGLGLDHELSYVDEYGNVTSTPPDPKRVISIKKEDILLGARKHEPAEKMDPIRKGKVTYFNDSKGYGFIKDLKSQDSIFVHANDLSKPIKENDNVTFEVERGKKGFVAKNVVITS